MRLAHEEITPYLEADLHQITQAYESGQALGRPARILCGIELDCEIRDPSPDVHPHEAKKYNASVEEFQSRRAFLKNTVRSHIMQELTALEPTDEEEAQRKSVWLWEAMELNVPELMTYVGYSQLSQPTLGSPRMSLQDCLRQQSDNPQETLEFRFGKAIYQEGYYDLPGSMEKRTHPGDPLLASTRARRTIRVFQGLGQYYGCEVDFLGSNVNMSVHIKEGNQFVPLHDLSWPDGREFARLGAAGMLRAIADSLVLDGETLAAMENAVEKPQSYTLQAGITRNNDIRVLPNRYELRRGEGQHEPIEYQMLALSSGFAYGVRRASAEVTGSARLSERDWFVSGEGFYRQKHLRLLRAMQTAHFDDEGFITSNPENGSGVVGPSTVAELFDAPSVKRTTPMMTEDFAMAHQLLRTIHLRGGALRCDPARFEDWLQEYSQYADALSIVQQLPDRFTPEYINDKLARLRCTRVHEISAGPVEREVDIFNWHEGIKRFEESDALGYVSQTTRRRLAQELGQLLPHEAVLEEYLEYVIGRDRSWGYNRDNDGNVLTDEQAEAYMLDDAASIAARLEQEMNERPIDRVAVRAGLCDFIMQKRAYFEPMAAREGLQSQYPSHRLRRRVAFCTALLEFLQSD